MRRILAPSRWRSVVVVAGAVSVVVCAGSSTAPAGGTGGETPSLLARRGHAMVFDEVRGRVLLMGGIGPSTAGSAEIDQASLWSWNGATWARLSAGTNGPTPRNHFAAAFDAARGRLVIMGGRQGDSPVSPANADTWEWDGTAWSQPLTTTTPSFARSHTASTYDRTRGRVVMAGGIDGNGNTLFEQLEWLGTSWNPLPGMIPGAAFAPVLVADGAQLLLLESRVPDRQLLTYTSAGNGAWTPVSTSGPAVTAYAVAPLPGGGLVLFGGSDGTSVVSDTWKWDGSSWTRLSGSGPGGRVGHAMALDGARGRVVLFGGENGVTQFGDTWEFEGARWIRVGSD